MEPNLANRPLVSVICIFLNEERFLEEAIKSVLGQRYDNWELLLVDDGSNDNSSHVARTYSDTYPSQIQYLQHPGGENKGMSATRNLGLSHASGQYVTFLDGDDILTSSKLEEQVAILEDNPDVDMLCSATKYWFSWTGNPKDGERDKIIRVGAPPGRYSPPELLTRLYPLGTGAAPCMSSLLVRRKAIDRVDGFEDYFRGMYEDQAFLSKMYLHAAVLITDQWWDCYRQHQDSACAVSAQTGMQPVQRRLFLDWFETYLSEQNAVGGSVRFALWEALLPYRNPYMHSLLKRGQSVYNRARWRAKRLFTSM